MAALGNPSSNFQFSIFHFQFLLPPRAEDDEVRQIALQLRRRLRDHDRVLVADGLAEAAGDAFVLLDERNLVVIRQRLVLGVDHGDALEGADVDAELAPGAELLDDLGFGDFLRLDARDVVAVLVLDGVDRAVNAADGAVDAALSVDVELALGRSPDRVGGAFDLANAAADALVGDEMGYESAASLHEWSIHQKHYHADRKSVV